MITRKKKNFFSLFVSAAYGIVAIFSIIKSDNPGKSLAIFGAGMGLGVILSLIVIRYLGQVALSEYTEIHDKLTTDIFQKQTIDDE